MKIYVYILLSLYLNWNFIKSQSNLYINIVTLTTGKTFNLSVKNSTALVASFTVKIIKTSLPVLDGQE
jgi:hypothetical protein